MRYPFLASVLDKIVQASPLAREPSASRSETASTGLHAGIIGGGPAGAMTGILLAREGIKVTIYEPRPKKYPEIGEKIEACVGCAGLLQENALRLLEDAGLTVPADIIQTKLKNNIVHFPGGEVIAIPTSALTVFRGFGPVGQKDRHKKITGLDAWLLNEAEKAGATVIEAAAARVISDGQSVEIQSKLPSLRVDFVVGSYGHNTIQIEQTPEEPPLEEPVVQPASVREYYLGEENVRDRLRDSQHIFGNPTKNIWYASIFPKGAYISLALMGRNGATQGDFKEFLSLPNVKDLIGDLGNSRISCGCTSSITIRSPKTCILRSKSGGFLVAKIGDAGASRPRKNGIFAALDSAVVFSESLKKFGNTARAVDAFNRYTAVNYSWDNWPSELVLKSTNLFLNHKLPRKFLVHLSMGRVPFFSKAINEAIALVSTGKAPYWQIPFRVIWKHPKDRSFGSRSRRG